MNYPSYLPPLVLSSAVATVAVLLFGLNAALQRARWLDSDRRRTVWTAGGLLTAWFFAALVPVSRGFYRGTASRVPTIQYGLLLPIIVGLVLYRFWPTLSRAVAAVPQEWIVGVQLYRALGFIFLVLCVQGWLPGAFAWPAGAGDTAVGLLAPAVAMAYARKWRGATGAVRGWNLLGITDLVVAVGTGFLTSPSPLQRLALDAPNKLVTAFPLAMVPAFLVPLSILLHLASLKKLRQDEIVQPRVRPVLVSERN